MMKLYKHMVLGVLFGLVIFSCEDDPTPVVLPEIRDESEVAIENMEAIRAFLETHYYKLVPNLLNPDYMVIQFDTIAGEDSDEQSIMDSPLLKTKTLVQNDVDYTLYYLQLREGAETKPKPTFADLVVVTYKGRLLNLSNFGQSVSPIKFNLPGEMGGGGVIKGFRKIVTEFRGATEYTVNPDNTIDFSDDFGIGAIFIPSGLAYFNAPPQGSIIPQYAPVIFTFQLYETIQGDPDEDGVPSSYEDLNGDNYLLNDDSDGDLILNFVDDDDDNDGTPTKDEIVVEDGNSDGYIAEDEITFTDSNDDGTPDYLDPEVD